MKIGTVSYLAGLIFSIGLTQNNWGRRDSDSPWSLFYKDHLKLDVC